jgi:hypothetical protein
VSTLAGPAIAAAQPLPWRRGVAWLLFLGPLFFASYGFANWFAAQRADVAVVSYAWERAIPFLPWTIVPYWSIDLLYGLSFLACRDARDVDRHGLRLLTVQLIAIGCFLLYPMRFSFDRPEADGLLGALFAALASFDQPFNQAPSLHIALLVVVWVRLGTMLRGWPGALAHAWLALIGISVLTTFQHHFIDIPTGALAGFAALWLWPDPRARIATAEARGRWTRPAPITAAHRRLAWRYGAGAAALIALAAWFGGAALWLAWGAIAIGLVALAYARLGAGAFQKQGRSHSIAATALYAPYTACAWLNSRLWTRRHPGPDEVADGVWIGRMPSAAQMRAYRFAGMVDLCAELPAPQGPCSHRGLPWLDLVAPSVDELRAAAAAIEAARREGAVLVCCALGYGRSACAVAAWLLVSGRADDVDAAAAVVGSRRRGARLGEAHRRALAELHAASRQPAR